MVQVILDLWKAKYGTSFYDIDTVTGQVYVNRDGKRTAIPEKCSFKPIVGMEIMSTTPIGGLGMVKLIVETPQSTLGQHGTPPVAKSTKKLGSKHYPVNLGESFIGSKDWESTQSGIKLTPESKASTLDSEDQPSPLHLGPTPGNLGGVKRSNVKTRGATPYCMHCGYKDNLHDPNCPVVREKAMYFQCSFCGDIGHPSDNCAARLQALQEQQKRILMFLLWGGRPYK